MYNTTIKSYELKKAVLDYDRHLVPVMALNSLIQSKALTNYVAMDECGNISVVDLHPLYEAEREVGISFVDSFADSTEGVLCYDSVNNTPESFCIDRFDFFEVYNTVTLKNLENCSYEQTLQFIASAIKEDFEVYSDNNTPSYTCVDLLPVIVIELALYSWFKNNFKKSESETPDSDSDEIVSNNSEEGSMSNNNPVYFNSNDWELAAPKTYFYKGSNPLYPSTITADDFNLNTLLDECMKSHFTSDNKAFYIKSEPTSDRKNGASKSFMFMKDGSAVYCIDSITKKMRELSMSAAGGKDGIVSRPYYYISFPLAGKSRQLPLHKILAVFAHAEELINERNRVGVPLCGLVPNHKDNNGINNDISNLEWVSPDENKLHSSAVELLAMADAGRYVYLVDKDHTPEVWVSAKDQWVVPNRNILNFKLSIKDIYNYLETHHITIAGHSIRAIVNVHDFISYLKSNNIIREA